jgi:hypothetical protein
VLKKIIFIACLFVSAHNSFAETCPTILEIKNNYFRGWQALNINSGNPVPTTILENFRNTVQHFALAEWMEDAPEGAGHCYYQGQDRNDPGYLEVFLAKANVINSPDNHNWKPVGSDVMQCRVGIDACVFQSTN